MISQRISEKWITTVKDLKDKEKFEMLLIESINRFFSGAHTVPPDYNDFAELLSRVGGPNSLMYINPLIAQYSQYELYMNRAL